MYELWFEILQDFTDYRDYMGLSLVVRLCKWSLLGLISYNLGGSVTGGEDVTPGPGLNRINRRLIPLSCNFFSGSPSRKNSKVKRAWPRDG